MSFVPFKANKFDDFVSFSILSLKPSPNGKFLAAATDTSRQIIFESGTSNIVRDLYGERTLYYTSEIYLFQSSYSFAIVCQVIKMTVSRTQKLHGVSQACIFSAIRKRIRIFTFGK